MEYIVKAIGILILAAGIVFIVKPDLIRTLINFAMVGKRVYIGGIVRLVFGALLLLGSFKATIPWIPITFGALILLSGVTIFLLPITKLHQLLEWFKARTDNHIMIMSSISAAVGVALIYSV